jgi:hypothetical protein
LTPVKPGQFFEIYFCFGAGCVAASLGQVTREQLYCLAPMVAEVRTEIDAGPTTDAKTVLLYLVDQFFGSVNSH